MLFRSEKAREIDVTRQNPALAGVTLPAGIRVTAELAEAEDAELVLYAVPSLSLIHISRTGIIFKV